jgi:leucyl aminopeptidase
MTFKLPILEARASLAKNVEVDVVGVSQDAAKKLVAVKGPYAPLLDKFRKGDSFAGASGSAQLVWFGGEKGAQSALFVGLGPQAQLTEEKLRIAGGAAWAKLSADKVKAAVVQADSFVIDAKGASAIPAARAVRAFAEGLVLAAYQINTHRQEPKFAAQLKLTFVTKDKALLKQLDAELDQVAAIGEAVLVTRNWSNEPSNIGTPEFYANEAKRLAAEYGLKCRILTDKDAAKEKMGLFVGVGQGAAREGRIVVLEYTPKGAGKDAAGKAREQKTIALVGKGVTFDSGGISIKPSMRMEEMKHDMTGAATLMGSILLAARWKVPNKVIAILAFTENMPDGNAIQPGNVLDSRNGKTVEIINTDAEGRLILADVLDYAQDMKPDAILDAATLTGAVSIALGKHCAAVLGNNDELIEQVRAAGALNGERIWQLPLYDEYFDDLKSEYADMKNSANDSYGGTIRGAIFLKQFIKPGFKWAHLDIAATAYNLTHVPYYPKRGASGAYVRTVAQFTADFRG